MPVTIDGSNTPTAGGIGYGDGTELAFTSAGTSGQALLSAGAGVPTWGTPTASTATTATNLAGGFAGGIPYQSAPGTTAITASGSSGQVLTSNGVSAPTWGTPATATNLAGGSNGTIPYQSASGATQMLAVGSAGQVLQTNGVGAPSWVTPGGGSWTFLQTLTASSSADLTYSGFTTTYNVYAVVFASVVPANDGTGIRCNPYTTSGGAETNNYTAAYYIDNGTASNTSGTSSTNTALGSNIGNAYRGLSGVMYFSNPKGASGYMTYWFQTVYTSGTQQAQMRVGGGNAGSSLQYDGFVVSANSGNLASGTVRVYGIKNS